MVDISVAAEDLGRVRFVSDPLWEASSSLFALVCQGSQSVHRRLRALVRDRPPASMGLLTDICGDPAWVPDLLAPEPDPSLGDDVESSLRRVADLDVEVAERDLDVLRAKQSPPPCAELDARAFQVAVADALVDYWAAALAPLWDRARLTTEADIAHHAQAVSRDGLASGLSHLHERVSFEDNVIHVDCEPSVNVGARGGVWLVPSVFRWPGFAVQYETPRPVICYASRGAGRVWSGGAEPDDAVANLLGAGRARVLAAVGLPASTTEVADGLGLAKGTVSEHLSALAATRLVSSRRSGRRVLYARTHLGDELLG